MDGESAVALVAIAAGPIRVQRRITTGDQFPIRGIAIAQLAIRQTTITFVVVVVIASLFSSLHNPVTASSLLTVVQTGIGFHIIAIVTGFIARPDLTITACR